MPQFKLRQKTNYKHCVTIILTFFWKHALDIAKTSLLQMTLKPKADIKPLNQKPYTNHFNSMLA